MWKRDWQGLGCWRVTLYSPSRARPFASLVRPLASRPRPMAIRVRPLASRVRPPEIQHAPARGLRPMTHARSRLTRVSAVLAAGDFPPVRARIGGLRPVPPVRAYCPRPSHTRAPGLIRSRPESAITIPPFAPGTTRPRPTRRVRARRAFSRWRPPSRVRPRWITI